MVPTVRVQEARRIASKTWITLIRCAPSPTAPNSSVFHGLLQVAERLFKVPLQEVMHSGGAHGSRAGEEVFTLEMLSKSSAYTTYIGITAAAEDEPEYTREIFE